MDARRCKPIELLDAVVDLVEFPQPGKSVEGAMGQIETDIGHDKDLDNLDPIGLRGNSIPHPNRHHPSRYHCHADDQDAKSKNNDRRVQQQKHYIIEPAAAENALPPPRQKLFQWHENKCGQQKSVEPIYWHLRKRLELCDRSDSRASQVAARKGFWRVPRNERDQDTAQVILKNKIKHAVGLKSGRCA